MYTHFRTEFVRRSQATIVRRVTMTQFMLVVGLLVIGHGMLGLSWWAAPALAAAAYAAGYDLRGELVARRLLAAAAVRLRRLVGRPQASDVALEWDTLRN